MSRMVLINLGGFEDPDGHLWEVMYVDPAPITADGQLEHHHRRVQRGAITLVPSLIRSVTAAT